MHIKFVRLSGFKSYKECLDGAEFSEKHNVIVGRNGSGKSNFFNGIRFVLSDHFTNMSAVERQQLLHEGAGVNVVSAFVEIVFDNSDNRLPIDSEEVVLRRTIGLKKDEYFLNKKHISKSDVVNLLESAGFSRSNPYYIVQQGKVNQLTLMKDKQRLDLLKEVAGTRVYEERRKESLDIMKETQDRREKIDEVITYIQERLHELEDEKEELTAYQKLDRERRAREYALYDIELQASHKKLDLLEFNMNSIDTDSEEMKAELDSLKKRISEISNQIRLLESQAKSASRKKVEIEEERNNYIQQRAKIQLEISVLEDRLTSDAETAKKLESDLIEVEKEIKTNTTKLNQTLAPAYKKAEKETEQVKAKLHEFELRRSQLIEKQDRVGHFSTEEERNTSLQNELNSLDAHIKTASASLKELNSLLKENKSAISKHESNLKEKDSELSEREGALRKNNETVKKLELERDSSIEQRKRLWRKESEISNKISELIDNEKHSLRIVESSRSRQISSGLQALQKHVEDENIQGVYGPLISLISLKEEMFAAAVEAIGANQLWQVVVDTDETASKLMKFLIKTKGGRITFMPLSRLKERGSVKEIKDDRVSILMDVCLSFDPMYERAVYQVFGKALICKDLDVASIASKNYDFDCVTLDGDMVNRRGALHGGYVDDNRSRMKAYMEYRAATDALAKAKDDADKAKKNVSEIDSKCTRLMGEVSDKQEKYKYLCAAYEQLVLEKKDETNSLARHRALLAQREGEKKNLSAKIQDMEARSNSLKEEMKSELKDTLSPQEMKELHTLNTNIDTQKRQVVERSNLSEKCRENMVEVELLLSSNLNIRREDIKNKLNPTLPGRNVINIEEQRENLSIKKKNLEAIESTLSDLNGEKDKIENELGEMSTKLDEAKENLEEVEEREKQREEEVSSKLEMKEKILNQKDLEITKQNSAKRKIQELGPIPEDYRKYRTEKHNILMKNLEKCNENLKKYSHVNKKALDQFINFSDQREQLLNEKKVIDDGAVSIRELIDVLDEKKDEAIMRTFKGVAKHFEDVFAELVPGGKASMIMRFQDSTGDDDDMDVDDGEDGSPSNGEENALTSTNMDSENVNVSRFHGVGIKVSFTGGGESFAMAQLSGGQKAIVALALIFAIQRCDPAPFYLFDEIDQALDTTHRNAVARMIKKQADDEENPTQFITSTFRPELVEVADKCFGVAHQHKISKIHEFERQEAMEFVHELMQEEGEGEGETDFDSANLLPSTQHAHSTETED